MRSGQPGGSAPPPRSASGSHPDIRRSKLGSEAAHIATEAVEATYQKTEPMPAEVEGPNMRRLAADHRRLLGNGHCTRPVALDCNFETICERCGFFETGPKFVTILRRQRDHAAGNDQPDRALLFTQLLDAIDDNS
jgi:hypothetical protein